MNKVLIIGSCVSRDVLNFDASKSLQLVEYYARSSIAALASGDIPNPPDVSAIDSSFQRRVVEYELERHLFKSLPTIDVDFVLIDLIDERFDLLEMGSGAYATISSEFLKSKYITQDVQHSGRRIKSGSFRHRALWLLGARRLIDALTRNNLIKKVVVNRTFWAPTLEHGHPLPGEFPDSLVEKANKDLAWMYQQLEKYIEPHQFVSFNNSDLQAKPDHQWGVSPFHYVDSYYMRLLTHLLSNTETVQSEHAVSTIVSKTSKALYRAITSKKVVSDFCDISFSTGVENNSSRTKRFISPSAVSGNGRLTIEGEAAKIEFPPGTNTYQLRAKLSQPFEGNGIAFRLKLSGWTSLRYLAFGYTYENQFRHIKIVNIAHNRWVTVDFSHDDLCFGLQNEWGTPSIAHIADVRLYVSGHTTDQGASIEILECLAWRSELNDFPLPALGSGIDSYCSYSNHGDIGNAFSAMDRNLTGAILRYLGKCFRDSDVQAEQFMLTGSCPLYGGKNLDWGAVDSLPSDLGSVGTFRFSWHALHPATMLMMKYHRTGNFRYLFSARQIVEDWLEKSFFRPDEDRKFAWYDHGTAERLLALVLMWSIGIDQKFDHRFMARMLLVIHKHAVLLNSEMFYASHQATRYHNHAWFQDLALMTTALAFPGLPCAEEWLETATSRLTDQLDHLIVRDNGYAVFVENSIGYHLGVQRLIEFAGELANLANKAPLISAVAKELPHFSDFFRYPDNRAPTQGDTFRRMNPCASDVRRLDPYSDPRCTILPFAGYAIVKGNHNNQRFMLCVLSTSLCRTHKHEDNLSFTLFFDGIEWLIDPSFFSHEYAKPLPAYLRSAVAHNALSLPGRPYSLEPGCAKLGGNSDGADFKIVGQHSAYESVLIEREIVGNTEFLNFNFQDRATLQSAGNSGDDLRFLLHCGEGVKAALKGKHLRLTHEESEYVIEISLPDERSQLYHGQIDENLIRGVTGLGFMQHTNINTVECEVPFNSNLAWTLKAVSRSTIE